MYARIARASALPRHRYRANYWISRDGKQGTDWSRKRDGTRDDDDDDSDGGGGGGDRVGVDAAQERIGASGAASLLPTTRALLPALGSWRLP